MPNEISASLQSVVSRPLEGSRPAVQSAAGPVAGRQDLPGTGQNLPRAGQGGTVGDKDLSEAVSKIQDYVQNLHRELHFTVDENSGRTIITVINAETDEIIRQIPPEEILALSRHLEEMTEGVLLSVQA